MPISRAKRDEDDEDDFDEEDEDGIDEGMSLRRKRSLVPQWPEIVIADELAALQEESEVITTGRRTRGVRVDYTKVQGFDDDDEDDEEPKRKRSSRSEVPSKSSSRVTSSKSTVTASAKRAEENKDEEEEEGEEDEEGDQEEEDHDEEEEEEEEEVEGTLLGSGSVGGMSDDMSVDDRVVVEDTDEGKSFSG